MYQSINVPIDQCTSPLIYQSTDPPIHLAPHIKHFIQNPSDNKPVQPLFTTLKQPSKKSHFLRKNLPKHDKCHILKCDAKVILH